MNRLIKNALRFPNWMLSESATITAAVMTFTVLGFATSTPSQAQTTTYQATLSSSNETSTVISPASGSITAELTGTTLTVSGTFQDLSADYDASVAGGAHIHSGMAGEDGAITFSLTPALDTDLRGGEFAAATNTFSLSAEQMTQLEQRDLYVNIHTDAHATGELRGQLVPEAEATFRASLSGGTETSPNTSAATGMAIAEMNGNELVVSGSFAHLETSFDASVAGGAHIHSGSAGTDGQILLGLTADVAADGHAGIFPASENSFTLTSSQVTLLQEHGLYVNIHTEEHQSGEIRGQFLAEGSVGLKATLSGSGEHPSASTTARGTVVAELDGSTLTVSGAFADLESDFAADVAGGAHIHSGMAGDNGGIMFNLTSDVEADARSGSFAAAENSFSLDAEAITDLQARGLYVNVHTEDHAAGEIRGQLAGSGSTTFIADLSGEHESPAVESSGQGSVLVELSGSTAIVSGSFADLSSDFDSSIQGGAHLHTASGGHTGAIELGLTAQTESSLRTGIFMPGDNRFELSTEQTAWLRDRLMYANIHTSANAAGEVRGQVLPAASTVFHASLNGAFTAHQGTTNAHGDVFIEITSAGEVVVTGGFTDLEADFTGNAEGAARVMTGDLGADGTAAFELAADVSADARSATFGAAENTFELTPDVQAALGANQAFVEIQSGSSGDVELRGHLNSSAASSYQATLSAGGSAPSQGAFVVVQAGDSLIVSGVFAGLEADFDAQSEAQIVVGTPDGEDTAMLDLTVQTDADLRGGVVLATENRFNVENSDITLLSSGDLAVSVRTSATTDSDLRGQLLVSANTAPGKAQITAPASNTVIDLSGDLSGNFVAEWDAATDGNGNDVYYEWQLAADANFETVIVTESTGTDTRFETSLQVMADALASFNAGKSSSPGEETYYHRVNSSDGSRSSPSESEDVTFDRSTSTDIHTSMDIPSTFELRGAYPNPFNPETTIQFDLPTNADVRVDVFNLLGERVETITAENMQAGAGKSVRFDARGLPSGLYLYRITAETGSNTFQSAGDMTLVK